MQEQLGYQQHNDENFSEEDGDGEVEDSMESSRQTKFLKEKTVNNVNQESMIFNNQMKMSNQPQGTFTTNTRQINNTNSFKKM